MQTLDVNSSLPGELGQALTPLLDLIQAEAVVGDAIAGQLLASTPSFKLSVEHARLEEAQSVERLSTPIDQNGSVFYHVLTFRAQRGVDLLEILNELRPLGAVVIRLCNCGAFVAVLVAENQLFLVLIQSTQKLLRFLN